jgi:ribosomal protein L40E
VAYCSNCGNKLPEDALFCPKCGTKTASSGASTATPSEEMREAFVRMSQEMEKAFNIAAKEVQEAFQIARNNIQKTINKEPVICQNCGEKNPATATYCFKCGKSLSGAQASKPDEGAQAA